MLLLFSAMVVSLLALMAMQWYWLQEGKQRRQAEFDQAVAEALRQTNYALEAIEASKLINKAVDSRQWVQRFDSLAGTKALYKFDTIVLAEGQAEPLSPRADILLVKPSPAFPSIPLPSSPLPAIGFSFDMPATHDVTLKRIDSILQNQNLNAPIKIRRFKSGIEEKTDSIVQVLVKQDSILLQQFQKAGTQRIVIHTDVEAKNWSENAQRLTSPKPTPAKRSRTVVQRQVPIDSLLAQVTLDFISPKLPIEQRITQIQFDSLLQSNLKQRGIQLPFQYWITREQGDTAAFVFGNRQLPPNQSHLYQTRLFPNDLFHLNEQLMLYFVDESAYLSEGMTAMYLLSGLLFLLIGGIFYAAFRYLMHQKRLSDIKSDFINNMSHEFKTPIATINLATDALNNDKVRAQPAQIDKYVGIIKSENRRMNQHVEFVLQTARLEKKELKLNLSEVELNGIIQQAVSLMQMQFESKGGEIHFDAPPALMLQADETHLLNVFTNLLDNAQKYCEQAPRVQIGIQTTPTRCYITVTDNGIGMSKDEKDQVFDQFYRIHTGNLHNVKGFGLGLSYVKAIVTAHGGQIGVSSEIGKGSTFTIQLPLNQRTS